MLSRRELGPPLAVAFALASTLLSVPARAEEPPPPEAYGGIEMHEGPRYVFGIGAVVGADLGTKTFAPGGNAFFEFEALSRLLSLAGSASYVRTAVGSELGTVVLFKMPLQIRPGFELELGLGPEALETLGAPPNATYFGVEGVLSLLIWPSSRFGLFATPTWDLAFKTGSPTTSYGPTVSYGLAVGPMVSWR